MSRLKRNANYVSPFIHNEVEKQMTNPDGNSSQVLNAQMDFVIAKRLLADLPIVPTNERTYELCQEIQMGVFADCGDPDENWDNWKKRAREVLEAKGIFVLHQANLGVVSVKSRLRKQASPDFANNLSSHVLSEMWRYVNNLLKEVDNSYDDNSGTSREKRNAIKNLQYSLDQQLNTCQEQIGNLIASYIEQAEQQIEEIKK